MNKLMALAHLFFTQTVAWLFGNSPYNLAQLDKTYGKRMVFVKNGKNKEVVVLSYPKSKVDKGIDWLISVAPVNNQFDKQTQIGFIAENGLIEWDDDSYLRFLTPDERLFGVK